MEAFSYVFQIVTLLFFLGAIPWAYTVVRELASIRTKLDGMTWQEKAIDALRATVNELKIEMASLKAERRVHSSERHPP